MTEQNQKYQGFSGTLLFNEPMKRHTSLQVGGPVDLFAVPESRSDLELMVKQLKADQTPWLALGGGYNLLVQDGGIRGAVISLRKLDQIRHLGEGLVEVWAGAFNLQLVRFGQQLGLGGVGFISGIPGTLGGALRMNAGAYGHGLLDHLHSLTLLRGSQVMTLAAAEISYGYRRLDLQAGDIILAATIRMQPTDPALTEQEIVQDQELRAKKHNVGYPSAGSFFKNPPGQSAWQLIDVAGMRGFQHGGAQMSELHSNFMINRNNATASDCLELAAKVKQAVKETTGFQLEEEVRIVGEPL